jgi:hypothetical protein
LSIQIVEAGSGLAVCRVGFQVGASLCACERRESHALSSVWGDELDGVGSQCGATVAIGARALGN